VGVRSLKFSKMKSENNPPDGTVKAAVEAINNLTLGELDAIFHNGQMDGIVARDEIERAPVSLKSGVFYRYLLPSRNDLISLFANTYRRYFKLALAHPGQAGRDLHEWAWSQLQPFVGLALEWIRDWYILACDGENQSLQTVGSVPFTPGQTASIPILTAPLLPPPESWRAPAWLFAISIAHVGVGPLKDKNVPEMDSEKRLGAAHTRLLLKGARRVFLWELGVAIETVRNEEIAAAAATPAWVIGGEQTGEPKKPKNWLKGTEGLVRKADLSQYMHGLTQKQQMAASLKWEYGLGLTEIASRMGINHKTAHEHIEAAKKKMDEVLSSDKRKSNRAKSTPDS